MINLINNLKKEKKFWFDGSWVGEGIDFDEWEGEIVNFMSLAALIKAVFEIWEIVNLFYFLTYFCF